ncbi:capsule biosynthesis protein [Pseudaestuariivita atlantica]|uniref:Capsule biosynthesis protein n=1 Tax=Pseudaestuariivita atlantica TaxID=1317121 RepID=A0A0L1JSG8_9RHOB|nr:capsule biosynthesis protein [Pseudaestuariivita atlantica]KNG94681.1 capsule biosynthesis protein [Pseudaestuariivita atlantica]
MTTKPKAKKFRIRRPEGGSTPPATPAATQPDVADAVAATVAENAGTQKKSGVTSMAAARKTTDKPATARDGQVASAAEAETDITIESIRKEGLTGRQLRMARRVAQKHGLAATSDFDAVRLLRLNGIDPFQKSNMLELVVPDPNAPKPADSGKTQLPQTMPVGQVKLPSTQTASPAERRAREISEIQRNIAKRRRRKVMQLFTRLAIFVGLPTLIAGWYFYVIATPLYATKSEFLILKAESGGGAIGGLFSGTQFATNQDAIAVQSYLTSKDAMLRLDKDVGYKAHFSQDWIDPIQRLNENPSNEAAHKLFKRHVQIGYDPTEGVIKMEVTAADPETAAEFSRALISYAEERVDNLSRRKRENQVADAQRALDEATDKRRTAQESLVALQQENQIVDPEGRIASLRTQIGNVETQILDKELELAALLDNARPNRAKVEGTQGDIRRLNAKLAELNAAMTEASSGETSLAELSARIQMAQADLATRDLMLQSALETMEQTRRDALSQARYLTTSVVPVASEDPTYPRKFENTVLAFLIFSGIYLMMSLTASILREQVST